MPGPTPSTSATAKNCTCNTFLPNAPPPPTPRVFNAAHCPTGTDNSLCLLLIVATTIVATSGAISGRNAKFHLSLSGTFMTGYEVSRLLAEAARKKGHLTFW